MTARTTSGPAGLIVVDKPAGWTSHDVVARLRRLTGQRRTGHAGTLDPAATGVLPVALGAATRLLEYLSDAGKAYRAVIRIGQTTDTDDAEGTALCQQPIHGVTEAIVRAALPQFTGVFLQRPPIYSAIKRGGTPLYRLARAGREVAVEPRTVRIDRIDLVVFTPPDITVEVTCAKGTYIRSLARDLGEALGCGGHLAALRRTRTGPFDLAMAVTMEQIAAACAAGDLSGLILPPDAIAQTLPAVLFARPQAYRLLTGRTVELAAQTGALTRARAYDDQGAFLGIVALEGAAWRPAKMLVTPDVLARPVAGA